MRFVKAVVELAEMTAKAISGLVHVAKYVNIPISSRNDRCVAGQSSLFFSLILLSSEVTTGLEFSLRFRISLI